MARRGNGGWLEFEPSTGALYMSYLAAELADELDLQPLTDQPSYAEPLLQAILQPAPTSEVFLALALDRILPAPSERVAVSMILDFRVDPDHRAALLRFRRTLREFASSIEDDASRRELGGKVDELADRVEEEKLMLRERLHASGIQTVLQALEAVWLTPADAVAVATGPIGWTVLAGRKFFKLAGVVLSGKLRREQILQRAKYSYVYDVDQIAAPAGGG